MSKTGWVILSCATLLLSPLAVIRVARGETAAEAAKRPVVGPKPARLADGRPNWTGFWVPQNGMLEVNIGLGGSPAPPPGSPAGAPPGAPPGSPPIATTGSPPGTPPGAPGSPPAPGTPPTFMMAPPFSQFSALKSPYREQMGKAMQDAMTGKVADPVATCFPPGMPRMMQMVYGMELLQTPGQIAITSEWQAASRRIWLDQKTHTKEEELDPSYTGESIAHWEGDSLIVDTVGIRADVPLNYMGLPHSPKLHVTEKFTQTKPGILVDVITIDDPDAFVSPWTETETYRFRPDLRIEEFVCLENNRNVGPHGEAQFSR